MKLKQSSHKLLVKAYSFHSFNPYCTPNIYRSEGLDRAEIISSSAYKARFRKAEYWFLLPMLIFSCWLLFKFYTSTNDAYLSPLVIACSATLAFFGVLKTLITNRIITAENNALAAKNNL